MKRQLSVFDDVERFDYDEDQIKSVMSASNSPYTIRMKNGVDLPHSFTSLDAVFTTSKYVRNGEITDCYIENGCVVFKFDPETKRKRRKKLLTA